LVFEEKRLRNDGTETARSEQADQSSKEMNEKNHQMAHRRMVARWRILGEITIRQPPASGLRPRGDPTNANPDLGAGFLPFPTASI
jgi:hypothetical protein